MPGILVPSRRRWTAQPQRLVAIDAPPGASVRFALLGSQGMRNLVGVQPTITGTPIVSHLRGLPVVRLDTSNRFSAGPKVIDRGRFTVVFVGGLDAPSTSYGCMVFGQVQSNTDTASAATYDWSIYESAAANQVFIQASNGSAVVNASPPAAPAWIAGKQRSVAACFDAGVPKISVDGGAVGVGAALSGGLVAANWGMASGGYWGNSSYNPVVRIALAVVLDGWAASPAELQALSANPWQIFRARRRAIYVDMGAGGGIACDRGTATATGKTASVSAATAIQAAAAVASATGKTAGVAQGTVVAAARATADATGKTAGIAQATAIAASVAAASATGQNAAVSSSGGISCALASASATGKTAGVSAATNVSAALASAAASGKTAGVAQYTAMQATRASASATGKIASVSAPIVIPASVAAAVASGKLASVGSGGGMTLTQGDINAIAAAVWAKVIEGALTAEQIQRILLAVNAGDATGLESGAPLFKSQDGTKNRVVATYSAGARVVTSRDAT